MPDLARPAKPVAQPDCEAGDSGDKDDGEAGRVEDEGDQHRLMRRVPGASLRPRDVPPPTPPVLSDEAVQLVQSLVAAERAVPEQAVPEQAVLEHAAPEYVTPGQAPPEAARLASSALSDMTEAGESS